MDPINRYQKWKKKHPRMEDEDDVATEINSTVRVRLTRIILRITIV